MNKILKFFKNYEFFTKLDEKDKQLLSLLQKNCKLSLRELSQIIEIRETTIFTRIKRLENVGVIKEYRAILDPRSVGKNVLAFILIKYDPSSGFTQREIAEKSQTYQKFKKFI